MKIKMVILGLLVLFLVGIASAVPQTFNVNGKLTFTNGTVMTGTYSMTFRLYEAYTGGSAVWDNIGTSVTTDSSGIYHVILTDVNVSDSVQYYLGVEVASDGEMTPRINLTSSMYALRANVSDSLNVSNNYEMGNLTLGQKITFAFGEMIDNLVSGWIAITGNLSVSGAINSSDWTNVSITESQISDLSHFNATTNDSINNYIADNNASVNNYIVDVNTSVTNTFSLYTLISELVDKVGNWTLDKVNYYTSSQVDDINTSMLNYVGVQNGSMVNYIGVVNTSVNNYIVDVNTSVTNAINSADTDTWVANFSSYYTSSQVDDINTSMLNYVGVQNTSLVNYIGVVNTSMNNWITNNNASVVNHINLNNASMGNYVVDYVGTQNTSMVNYIGVQNTSMVNYITVQNTSLVNYIGVVNTSVTNTFGSYRTLSNLSFVGGNVGIGTTSPNQRLHVYNGGLLVNNSGNASLFFVDNVTGNVGIGTGSPKELLNVYDGNLRIDLVSGQPRLKLRSNSNSGAIIEMERQGNDGSFFIMETGAGGRDTLEIYGSGSGGATGITLTTSGNVGIGTTSPNAKLEIANASFGHELNVSGLLYVNSTSGNVGIGTASPGMGLQVGTDTGSHSLTASNDVVIDGKLEVDGTSFFDNSLYIYNEVHFISDDSVFNIGAGDDVTIQWETADADANAFSIAMPNGDGTNVPVMLISNYIGDNTDFGWFDGVTGPRMAFIDADADSYATFGASNTDDKFEITLGGNAVDLGINGGNLGIGTTSPTSSLTINSSNAYGGFEVTNSTGSSRFFVNASSGKVGIGTASPSAGLAVGDGTPSRNPGSDGIYVEGLSEFDGTVYFDGVIFPGTVSSFILDGNNKMTLGSPGANFYGWYDSGSGTQILTIEVESTNKQVIIGDAVNKDYDHTDQSNPTLFIHSATDPDTSNDQWLSLAHDQTDSIFDTGLGGFVFNAFSTDSAFVIKSDGNVGIGTTSPTSSLTINSSNAYGGFEVTNSTGSSRFFVNSTSGNVGIGTTSPQTKLHVNGNILSNGTINSTSGASFGGNVGIGTTTPNQRLHVYNGGLLVNNSGNASLFFVDNVTGNVGIGTGVFRSEVPVSKLDIIGTSLAGGSTTIKDQRILKLELPSGSTWYQRAEFWLGRHEDVSTDARTALTISLQHEGSSVDADTDVMTLLSSGNVGIGTTSPGKKLEINGTSQGAFTFDPDVSPLVMNTTANNMTITSAGGSVIIRLG